MYATAQGLIDRFGELFMTRLTNEAPGPDDGPDTTAIERAITAVTGIIDGYLRDRYTLPLSEIPAELQGYAEDLVLDRLYSGKPERENSKEVRQRAGEAMTWLRDIKKGLASLSVPEIPAAAGSNTDAGKGFFRSSKKSKDRLFDDKRLDRFTR